MIFHYFLTSQLSSALVVKQEAVILHNCAAGPEIRYEAQSVFLEQMVRISKMHSVMKPQALTEDVIVN